MQPSTTDLQAAFNRTGLRRDGYSFQKAIECDLLKKCLVRIALNMQNKATTAPHKPYWWQEN